VGPVDRATVLKMATVHDSVHRAVLAFNVPVLAEAQVESSTSQVRLIRGEVIYRIIEEYVAWRTQRSAELEAERRLSTVHPAKFKILPGYVFRSSKPAIVGVKVLAGTLRPGVRLMKSDGTEIGFLRGLQKEGRSVTEAAESEELAASIEGAVIGRNTREGDVVYVSLPESAARALRVADLSEAERSVLDEVVRLRRIGSPFWGQ
jgi:translation initiation factor 5B